MDTTHPGASLRLTDVAAVPRMHPHPARGEGCIIWAVPHEPEALGELLSHHAGQLYRYLRARTPTEQDAEDLTQQAFVKAIEALPRYRDRGVPLGAWLFRIAHNVLVDARRRHHATVSWDVVPDFLTVSIEHNPEPTLLQQEARVRIRELLESLTATEQELILLRFAGGLTLLEVGMVVGKSESTVHREITRILRLMKEHYGEE